MSTWRPAPASDEELEELLSRPNDRDIAAVRALSGNVVVLGAGGKMGPSLARRVRRAADEAGVACRVAAVSRFSTRESVDALEQARVEVLPCDLLDPRAVEALPTFENVLYLAGMKFGASERPSLTWALNTVVPALVARRFSGARIVVFSTGNVYPLLPASAGGATEEQAPAPVGEYAQSCLGRERVFEHFSHEHGTPGMLFRLFYAIDLRYGVLVDVARKVLAGEPIDLGVGYANVIWQGDANSYALGSLALCESPPRPLNVTGPKTVSIREAALSFGRRFSREVRFTGSEGKLALLGSSDTCRRLLGEPDVSLGELSEWVAAWVERGGRSLGKPTKYERSDGRF
jgi:nucleoside-diphosphate-sugar epimerase